MSGAPPAIFSPNRRAMAQLRADRMQSMSDAARFLVEDVADDLADRLSFLRHAPQRSLVIGDRAGVLAQTLPGASAAGCFDLEQPWPVESHDLIVLPFVLDTVNDLPGALIHARCALSPGGLAFVTMLGAGSLPVLREVMLAADGDRPAPRLHPQVDVRAGGQLLQRAGYANPVVDSRSLNVRYGRFESLVADLRAQGLGNVLVDRGPSLNRAALSRAREAFAALADSEGRVTETFEILTFSGWR
ncbi:methyltransferase [Novosphingobium aquae]|uniref:Methyltransferase n=1 Tax=Novosphingobium aquae TaxID=3133435 RepID=A0ABU8S6L6_9SPHN